MDNCLLTRHPCLDTARGRKTLILLIIIVEAGCHTAAEGSKQQLKASSTSHFPPPRAGVDLTACMRSSPASNWPVDGSAGIVTDILP